MRIECPRPTPIQARLLASMLSLKILALLYWSLLHPQLAYAAELGQQGEGSPRGGLDHNWHRIENEDSRDIAEEDAVVPGLGRAHMMPRADTHRIDANDSPNRGNLTAGQTNIWIYTQALLTSSPADQTSSLPGGFPFKGSTTNNYHLDLRRREDEEEDLEKRQTSRTLYVSINTCSQPLWSGQGTQTVAPPQLTLYIGQSGNQDVGAGAAGSQQVISLQGGYANVSFQVNSETYLAVSAPSTPSDFNGGWTYDVAVSIDGFYHGSRTDVPFLYLVDTDGTSALLVTENVTQANSNDDIYKQWMALKSPLPFTVFADTADNTKRMGLEQSYCGLKSVAQIPSQRANDSNDAFMKTSMITRGINYKPKQQFVLGNMTSGTIYNASLALVGNGVNSGKGVVGGGGTVWLPTSWKTKKDGNCQLIYDMDFCSDVAYAVPSNPNTYQNVTSLRALYDDYAGQLYQNFTYSLKQINCNTTNDQRYSLSRTCDDCDKAYKQWLCAVTIPRCEDFSNTASFLQPRNVGQAFFQNASMLSYETLLTSFQPMPGAPTLPGSPIDQTWNWSFATNQSRNPAIIDQMIQPGPYKEVLPCEDICYNLVQSCPASLQFSCPSPGQGLEVGYAQLPSSKSIVQCNFPGALYYIDNGRQIIPSISLVLGFAIAVVLLVVGQA